MSILPRIPSAPRASRARISFPLILALTLIFLLAASVAIPESAGAVEPLTVSVSLDKTSVAVGEPVTATWSASGGRAPYKYSYSWYVISADSYLSRTSMSNVLDTSSSFTPDIGEKCYCRVYAYDADGRSASIASDQIPVTGSAPVSPLAVTASLDKAAVAMGEPVTATWSASGGRAPYKYSYSWYVISADSFLSRTSKSNVLDTSSSFTPDIGEKCYCRVYAYDADGRSATIASDEITVFIYATDITMNMNSVTLDIGKAQQLAATLTPSSGTLKTISWSSSNKSVATVDDNGLVTAVGEGEATITASTVDGSGLSAECVITVNPPIPVESVSISGPSGPLAVGAKYRLSASVLPENATYTNMTWSTDNPGVATVENGLVTGVAKGTAVITATAPGGAHADWNVTVSSTASRLRAFAHDPGLTVAYSRWCLYFKVGAQYGVPPYTLDVSVEKNGVQATKTTLTASGSTDLTFTGILSTAVYTMKVTATDAAGRTDSASSSVDVYVGGGNLNVRTLSKTEPVSALTGLSFQNPMPSVAIGSTLTLSPVVTPSGALRPALEWDSDNPAAVTVSDTGVVRGVAEGTSVITAYATDGSGLSAKCTVKAIRPVTSITLNQGSAKLTSIGQTVTLQATVLPADASDKGVTWSTSSAAVATVSGGVVTAKGDGTATITATAKDGSGKSVSCAITVDTTIPVASVAIEAPGAPLYYGGKSRLKTTVLPASATDKTLTWSVSDPYVASVEDGVVTGIGTGRATITATAKSGAKATCEVVVSPTASRLRAFAFAMHTETSPTGIYLTVGAQYGTPPYDINISLSRNGMPLRTINTSFDQSGTVAFNMSSVPGADYIAIATVTDAKGRVDTASTTGYMYAQGADVSYGIYDEVLPYSTPTGMRFENERISVAIGRAERPLPLFSPAGENPFVAWASSNPSVATVEDGIVWGLAKGTSIITASTTDGSGLSASYTVTVYRDVDSVSLNQMQIKLTQGEKATLSATVLPADADYRSITWRSTNPSIATVSGGVVTGVRDGYAVIFANTPNGMTGGCGVTVSNKIESIQLTQFKDTPMVSGAYELNLRDTIQLTPQTVPASVGASFTYKSSNPKVLSVSSQGIAKGLKAGNCTVTITARNTSTAAALTKANIRVIVPAASVRMDPGFTIFVGTSRKLKASVSPSDATYQKLEWTSNNKSAATVDASGNVYGVGIGTADITATAHNGKYFTRQVRVTHPVGSIKLTAPVEAFYVGKTVQIKADVQPSDTADTSLKWTSSLTKIATVSHDGLVTGKSAGTVKITAAARDGSKKSVTMVLRVVKRASSISIKKSLTLFTIGKATEKLAITPSPDKSGYLSVTWLSDKPSVASVDQNGVVTAHADGTAVITATTDTELGKTATCIVTVWTYPTYIKLNLPATLKVGEKLPLIPPLVVDLNGSMKSLTWKSYNTRLATIDQKGVLTAKKPGPVDIRVTTANGLYAKARIIITK